MTDADLEQFMGTSWLSRHLDHSALRSSPTTIAIIRPLSSFYPLECAGTVEVREKLGVAGGAEEMGKSA